MPKRELEIDRIDNNGHYERGNLRFATRIENASNKRNTVLTEFHQKYWPYARSVVIRKLSKGLSRDEIIEDAELAVLREKKKLKGIEARLDFMIYEMPERITVYRIREISSQLWLPRSLRCEAMGGIEMGLSEDELQSIVDSWREATLTS